MVDDHIMRVRVVGTGWEGGPSLNTFYFESDSAADVSAVNLCLTRVHTAFDGVAPIYPSDIPHQIDPQVDVLDATTGEIVNSFLGDEEDPIPGEGPDTSRQAPHTAALLRLRTGAYLDGRRVQGRAFLSPLYSAMTDGAGTPTTTCMERVAQMGVDLLDEGLTGLHLVVWRRPREADSEHEPPITARAGAVARVTVTQTPDKFAVLRSRRD